MRSGCNPRKHEMVAEIPRGEEMMQDELPGFDELRTEAADTPGRSIKPFDPKYAGQTKARQAYTCDLCGRPIAPGQIYYQEGKQRFLGALGGRKLCAACYGELAHAD